MAAMQVNEMGFQPTGGLQHKSTVYGLNGHRAHVVIALSIGAYQHAIQKSRSFTALFSWTPGQEVLKPGLKSLELEE